MTAHSVPLTDGSVSPLSFFGTLLFNRWNVFEAFFPMTPDSGSTTPH